MRTEKRTYTITIADNGKVLMFNDGESKIFALSTIGVADVQELTIEQAIEQGMSEEQAQQYATETPAVDYETARGVYDQVEELGGFVYTEEPSDKAGQVFRICSLNGVELFREYKQTSTEGTTADTAIDFVAGITVKPNYFYKYLEMTFVYTGTSEKIAADWFDVRENMTLWDMI